MRLGGGGGEAPVLASAKLRRGFDLPTRALRVLQALLLLVTAAGGALWPVAEGDGAPVLTLLYSTLRHDDLPEGRGR